MIILLPHMGPVKAKHGVCESLAQAILRRMAVSGWKKVYVMEIPDIRVPAQR